MTMTTKSMRCPILLALISSTLACVVGLENSGGTGEPDTEGSSSSTTPTEPGEGPLMTSDVETSIDTSTTDDDSVGSTSQSSSCGDGVVAAGEDCDNGPENSPYAACSDECRINVCGDGKVHAGVEACDEGAANVDTGYCRSDCTLNVCGDGFVLSGLEECDAGEYNSNLYGKCDENCSINRCGDGQLDVGHEQCDAGEQNGSGEPGEDGMAGCGGDCGFAGRRLFLSSKLFSGDLGSRAGADLVCQNLAKDAGLPKSATFRAFLADSKESPNTVFGDDTDGLPFIAVTGLILALDYFELITHGPGLGLTITEKGEVMIEKPVWTNIGPFGDAFLADAEHTCGDWTSDDATKTARVGLNAVAPEAFAQWQDERQWLTYATKTCNGLYRIYCVEVPE